jgi:hypothetical protein
LQSYRYGDADPVKVDKKSQNFSKVLRKAATPALHCPK